MARQNGSITQMQKKLSEAMLAARQILKVRVRAMGETETKAKLINPILKALGWDVQRDDVELEFRLRPGDNPVDYALKVLGRPALFIEAKALGHDLSDPKRIAQVLGYAAVAGVGWAVLTNGDEYRLYNAGALVPADEKLFWQIRISDGSLGESAETLSLLSHDNVEGEIMDTLWEAHFVDRQVKQTLLEMLKSKDEGLVTQIGRQATKLRPRQIADSLGRIMMVKIDWQPVRPPGPRDGLTGLAAAAKVLAEATGPLHVREMVERMRSKRYWSSHAPTPEATIYSAILREIQTKGENSRFRKTERGKFGLSR